MTDELTVDGAEISDEVYATAEQANAEGKTVKSQRGDSADEIDPRRLYRDPTVDELRWYYQRTFAKVLVDKPIDDAYKYGFDIESDNADRAETLLDMPTVDQIDNGTGYIAAKQLAEKKARRDGFALIYFVTRERGNDSPHVSPMDDGISVDRISRAKVWTIDDLTSRGNHEQITDGTGLDHDEYAVRETGIVVNTDPMSADYLTPVGYMLDNTDPQFIHADRVQHFTWTPEVDGPYENSLPRRWNGREGTLGEWEGDSILLPSYDILKGIAKGNWALMQALFRDASHMYAIKVPDGADKEEFDSTHEMTRHINSKSSFTFPSVEYEMQQFDSGGSLDPDGHYDALFAQICATHEMTRSVLFGTQAGTVSGSEVDIKNYFNKIERYRENRAEAKIEEYLTMASKLLDDRTDDTYQFTVDIEWGPLFRVDEETTIKMWQNATNAMSTAIGSYQLTPDEARNVLSAEFTELEFDDLTETQKDELDRIRLATSGQGPQALASEGEYTSAPARSSVAAGAGQEAGGMEQGQTTSAENPAADAATSLERLAKLYDDDKLTDDEFAAAKESILGVL